MMFPAISLPGWAARSPQQQLGRPAAQQRQAAEYHHATQCAGETGPVFTATNGT